MTTSSSILLSQLLGQAPMLLVYLAGFVACAIFWQRSPFAATLAAVGIAVMLFSAIGAAVVSNYIFQNRTSSASIGTALAFASLAFSVVRAIGLGLVIGAVFVQRRLPEDRGFDVPMANTSPPYAQ